METPARATRRKSRRTVLDYSFGRDIFGQIEYWVPPIFHPVQVEPGALRLLCSTAMVDIAHLLRSKHLGQLTKILEDPEVRRTRNMRRCYQGLEERIEPHDIFWEPHGIWSVTLRMTKSGVAR